jgi:hypothetical protein
MHPIWISIAQNDIGQIPTYKPGPSKFDGPLINSHPAKGSTKLRVEWPQGPETAAHARVEPPQCRHDSQGAERHAGD